MGEGNQGDRKCINGEEQKNFDVRGQAFIEGESTPFPSQMKALS